MKPADTSVRNGRWRLATIVATVILVASACTTQTASQGPSASGPAQTRAPSSAPSESAQPGGPDLTGEGVVIVQTQGGLFEEAQRAAHFEPFEQATGIKVIGNPSVSTAQIRASIEAGAPQYDIVDVSGGRIDGWSRDGLLTPIDYSFWDPAVKDAFSPVPAHEFAVPNYFFAMKMAWDPAALGESTPASWADFWDTDKFPGARALPPGSFGPAGQLFEIALLADGVPLDELYPLDLDRAFASLDRIKPAILKFWAGGAESVQLISDKQVALSAAWNGRIDGLKQQGGSISSTWDQAILTYDTWIVPKGAPNAENAMKFLAFISQPRQQARFAEVITYAPPNPGAFELIGSERAKTLATSPENAALGVIQDFSFWNSDAGDGKTWEQVAIERWEEWIAQ